VPCLQLELTNPRTFSTLRDVDAIVHAAALVPRSPNELANIEALWNVNALGTLHILIWAHEHAVKNFVYCSSMAVYSPDAALPVTEEGPTYPMGRSSIYGLSKLAGEVFAENFRRENGPRIFSLRFSTIYGKGMNSDEVLPRFLRQARSGETLWVHSRLASSDFLYVKDAAAAIENALQSESRGGVFNIGSGRETRILDLARIACEQAGAGSVKVKNADRAGGRRFCMRISKAVRELGFKPRYTLPSGLADWFRGRTS